MSFSVHDHSSHRSQDQTYRQFFLPPRDSFRASFGSLDLEEQTSDFHASFNDRLDYLGKCMHARAAYSRLDTVTAIDVRIFVDTLYKFNVSQWLYFLLVLRIRCFTRLVCVLWFDRIRWSSQFCISTNIVKEAKSEQKYSSYRVLALFLSIMTFVKFHFLLEEHCCRYLEDRLRIDNKISRFDAGLLDRKSDLKSIGSLRYTILDKSFILKFPDECNLRTL